MPHPRWSSCVFQLVEKGSPHSVCLLESGKLLPGVKVVIANPETKGQCADSHLGEVKKLHHILIEAIFFY